MGGRPRMDRSERDGLDLELTARATQLYAVYAWAIDYGDFDLLESLVDPEVVITRGETDHPGLEAFMKVYHDNWSADWSAGKHYISNVIASRQSDGLIRSRAYFQAVFISSDHSTMVAGRYDDLLTDNDDHLRILHKRIQVEGSLRLPATAPEWAGYQVSRVK